MGGQGLVSGLSVGGQCVVSRARWSWGLSVGGQWVVWRARDQEEAGQWLRSGWSVGGQEGQVVSGGCQWVGSGWSGGLGAKKTNKCLKPLCFIDQS